MNHPPPTVAELLIAHASIEAYAGATAIAVNGIAGNDVVATCERVGGECMTLITCIAFKSSELSELVGALQRLLVAALDDASPGWRERN